MKILKFICLISLTTTINSDCLSKEVLEGLGFTSVKETPEIIDQDICRGLFKSHGACVDPESVKALIQKK